jgi:hypothetical protein
MLYFLYSLPSLALYVIPLISCLPLLTLLLYAYIIQVSFTVYYASFYIFSYMLIIILTLNHITKYNCILSLYIQTLSLPFSFFMLYCLGYYIITLILLLIVVHISSLATVLSYSSHFLFFTYLHTPVIFLEHISHPHFTFRSLS